MPGTGAFPLKRSPASPTESPRSFRRPERFLRLRRQGAGPEPAGQLPSGFTDPAGVTGGVRGGPMARPRGRPRSRPCRHGGPRSDSPRWPVTGGRCPILSNGKKGWEEPPRTPYFNRLPCGGTASAPSPGGDPATTRCRSPARTPARPGSPTPTAPGTTCVT